MLGSRVIVSRIIAGIFNCDMFNYNHDIYLPFLSNYHASHTALLSFENGSSLSWMAGMISSFYPCIFPPFCKLKASKDRIYDAIAVGLGNEIPNKLPMLKNSFL